MPIPLSGPDFVCVGAQKGGTRWLFDQLEHHPDFWMPPVKEFQYLNGEMPIAAAEKLRRDLKKHGIDATNAAYAEREKARRPFTADDAAWLKAFITIAAAPFGLDRYAMLFAPKGERLSGDVSPSYAVIPREEAQAFRDRFPATRILYIARDPVSRLWSQYCMKTRKEKSEEPDEALRWQAFLASDAPLHSSVTNAVAAWRRDGDDPLFRLFFIDDLARDPAAFRAQVIGFIGGDSAHPSGALPPGYNRKEGQAKLPMPDVARAQLVEIFADELRACAASFGGAAAAWPARYGLGA